MTHSDCGPTVQVVHEHLHPQHDGQRITLCISISEEVWLDKKRGPGVKGFVTDLGTLETFQIRGAHCGLDGCWCDLEALFVATDGRAAQ